MRTLTMKDARMELKTTKETKELLTKAAVLDGMDLSAFMLASAMEKARAIFRDHAAIHLSSEGQKKLVNLLEKQPEPTQEMKSFRAKPRLNVR